MGDGYSHNLLLQGFKIVESSLFIGHMFDAKRVEMRTTSELVFLDLSEAFKDGSWVLNHPHKWVG